MGAPAAAAFPAADEKNRIRRMSEQRALLVIDVQRGFEDPELGPRDNPDAEENVVGPALFSGVFELYLIVFDAGNYVHRH